MGVGSGYLAEACARMTLGRRIRFRPTWVGSAIISPFLWAMHRKMWAWAALIFVLEVLVPVVLITLGTKDGVSDKVTALGLAAMVGNRIFWPAILKTLYCRHARLTIMHMHRMAPTYAADIDIATRGGTSRTSVLVGIVLAIVLSLLTWSLVDTLYASIRSARPEFSVPIELSAPAQRPKATAPATAEQDELLANENRWVSTRSRLRQLGQRVNAWIADRGPTLDPAALDIGQVSSGLLLGPGETLDGWKRYNADEIGPLWRVEDGAIMCDGKGHGEGSPEFGGSLITLESFGNFELELEWKISEGGNSGIPSPRSTGITKSNHSSMHILASRTDRISPPPPINQTSFLFSFDSNSFRKLDNSELTNSTLLSFGVSFFEVIT